MHHPCARIKTLKPAKRVINSDKGVSVSSTRGKLQVLQKHYEALGRMSEDSDFDSEWKEEVETKVSTCMCSSLLCDDEYLDRELR